MKTKRIKRSEPKLSEYMEQNAPDTEHALYNVVARLEEIKSGPEKNELADELIELIWTCFHESEQ